MAAAPKFQSLKLTELFPSPSNPRKHFDQAKLKELAESLKAGQIEPIVVRSFDAAKNGYEILAGERRFRAATLAGLEVIEAKILEVTDQRAIEITVVENLQREDLLPLEEADGIATLMSKGYDLDTIAKDCGKSPSWVSLRAKLRDLSPAWRKAMESDRSEISGWPASKLELIARFPADMQDAMLKSWAIKESGSVKDLQALIAADWLRLLKAAPFDQADAKLVPKAGACTTCPKRTGCQQLLFGESKDDRCTDGACWTAKQQAFVAAREAALKKDLPNLVKVDRESYTPQVKGAIGKFDFKEVKKATPGAVPALVVDGKGMGEQIWIKKGSPHESSSMPSKPKLSEKERVAQKLKARREIEVAVVKHLLQDCQLIKGSEDMGIFPKKITDMGFGKIKRPTRTVLFAMATALGLDHDWQLEQEALKDETWADVKAHIALGADQLDERMWVRLIHQITNHAGLKLDDDINVVCELVGLDAKAIRLAVRTGKPLPRTLAATFDEDGKPLKGVTAKPAKKPKAAKPKAKKKGAA